MPFPTDPSNRPILSRADLEAFDPQGTKGRKLCPLCGEGKPRDAAHRSLSVDENTGLWKCFRCGAAGKLRDFWEEKPALPRRDMARQRLQSALSLPALTSAALTDSPALPVPEAIEACEEVATPILLPLEGTPGLLYLERRGLDLTVSRGAGVSYCASWHGRPAVVFGLHDREGVAVAAQGRFTDGRRNPPALTAGPKKNGVFCTTQPGTAQPGAAGWLRQLPCLILTEAPIDALSLALAGYPALALCGTSGPDWLPLAAGLRSVLLALDADEAGDRASQLIGEKLAPYGARCHRLRPEGAKDWNEMLLNRGREALSDWLAFNALPHI